MRTVVLTKINKDNKNLVKVRDIVNNNYYVYVIIGNSDSEIVNAVLIKYYNEVPTVESIREEFVKQVDSWIEKSIENNCTWNNFHVQLNMENQFNYKCLYDFSKDYDFLNLPVTIKLNNIDDEQHRYYQFTTGDEFKDFYMTAISHVYGTLNKGWEIKKAFDSEYYSEMLKNI